MSFIMKPMGRVLSPVFGLLFGSMKPPKIEAQRLGELSHQTAKEGEPRPIVYGIGRPIGGNIMYMSQPIRKMVKTYVGKSGGKGGGKKKKQYQDVEHVYRYYAIRVCEGPISGFRRIWRNGALVYDGRKGSAWGAKNNHLFFKTYRLYTGSWTQMPDSVLQARQGMDIPAYRGTAYLVANNEDLTDFGGAIPQWQFEVVRSEGYYLTSRPYALETIEEIRTAPSTTDLRNSRVFVDKDEGVENISTTPSVEGVVLRATTFTYTYEPEQVETNPLCDRIYIQKVVVPHTYEPEQVETNPLCERVYIQKVVVPHTYEPEQVETNPLCERIYIHAN